MTALSNIILTKIYNHEIKKTLLLPKCNFSPRESQETEASCQFNCVCGNMGKGAVTGLLVTKPVAGGSLSPPSHY